MQRCEERGRGDSFVVALAFALHFLERSLTSYRLIVISTKFSSNVIVRKVQFHN